ncbi:hypothetical protein E2C01_005206 [Portunus trituberculatus]|uniref:Uncharacterized protein n=1 Tax=Portunus trituberculatus TaxID=210409 RepID=A0A5B7CW04_PORTR|nr:hypothetical protein [Portunus trituberculatus]
MFINLRRWRCPAGCRCHWALWRYAAGQPRRRHPASGLLSLHAKHRVSSCGEGREFIGIYETTGWPRGLPVQVKGSVSFTRLRGATRRGVMCLSIHKSLQGGSPGAGREPADVTSPRHIYLVGTWTFKNKRHSQTEAAASLVTLPACVIHTLTVGEERLSPASLSPLGRLPRPAASCRLPHAVVARAFRSNK